MKCPYCDVEMVPTAKQPPDRYPARVSCPSCSFAFLSAAPRPTGPKPPPGLGTQTALMWCLERLPDDERVRSRVMTHVMLYALFAIEAVSTCRTREGMRARLDVHQQVLLDKLRDLLDTPTGKDGAL